MAVNINLYKEVLKEFATKKVTLVAVSKTKPEKEILELYHSGQRDFGENYVQELASKYEHLPRDIRWHFIGHLQSNKVKFIAPFVSLIQSVDSEKLLKEINKQAIKNDRIIDCLLEIHIAEEETKFGFDEKGLHDLFDSDFTKYKNVRICGFMGMGSFSDDENKVRQEFKRLKKLSDTYFKMHTTSHSTDFRASLKEISRTNILSMGMSSDYKIAIEEGSNMVRIGSLLFGKRN